MMSDRSRPSAVARANRWSQLWLGMVCMILIANLQYAWTLFVNPLHQAHGWSIADIQIAFAIFIATETWLTPVAGWVVDNHRVQRLARSRAPAVWGPANPLHSRAIHNPGYGSRDSSQSQRMK